MPEHRIDITSVTLETILSMRGMDFIKEEVGKIDDGTKGVYIFYQISPLEQVWYVGSSENLRNRLSTHNFSSFFKLMGKGGCTIKLALIEYPEQSKEELVAIENVFISRLKPVLNLNHNQVFRQLKTFKGNLTYKFKSSPDESGDKTAISVLSDDDDVIEHLLVNDVDEEEVIHLLKSSSIRRLKKIASYCDVVGYSNMTKLQLAIAIKGSGVPYEDYSNYIASEEF